MAKQQVDERGHLKPKKSYRAPQLVKYGDLRKITLGKGGMMNDGGGRPATRK
jgi:hypothetical protein